MKDWNSCNNLRLRKPSHQAQDRNMFMKKKQENVQFKFKAPLA